MAVCEALDPRDVVFGTYRGHALYLARGGDMKKMVAELYGKATGSTGGKGGSMHLIAPEQGVMGTSAVVGTTIANAVGHAYAFRYRNRFQGERGEARLLGEAGLLLAPASETEQRDNAIVASFFGDGATEEGVFAESLNFAVLKKLPILFICENNGYAIHTHQKRRQGSPAIWERARAYGLPAEQINGNDFFNLIERVQAVVPRIRAGEGPCFLEVLTYRWKEHVGPGEDYHLGYRTQEEAQPWIDSDPVRLLALMLEPAMRARIEKAVEEEIGEAFAFAEVSPFPGRAELLSDIYKEVLPCPGSRS